MVKTLERRGPDDEGIYINTNVLLGHRRLVVVDLEGGKQPMTKNINGKEYTIVYNGELYNTEDALVKIMTEPKNALVRQYQYLFGIDDVELEFTDDALVAIAEKTLEKKTGARGLRGIMESVLMPIMYDTPSEHTISKVIIEE